MNEETDIQPIKNEGALPTAVAPRDGDEARWASEAKLACNALVWQWGQETLTLAQADALSSEILTLLLTRRG